MNVKVDCSLVGKIANLPNWDTIMYKRIRSFYPKNWLPLSLSRSSLLPHRCSLSSIFIPAFPCWKFSGSPFSFSKTKVLWWLALAPARLPSPLFFYSRQASFFTLPLTGWAHFPPQWLSLHNFPLLGGLCLSPEPIWHCPCHLRPVSILSSSMDLQACPCLTLLIHQFQQHLTMGTIN